MSSAPTSQSRNGRASGYLGFRRRALSCLVACFFVLEMNPLFHDLPISYSLRLHIRLGYAPIPTLSRCLGQGALRRPPRPAAPCHRPSSGLGGPSHAFYGTQKQDPGGRTGAKILSQIKHSPQIRLLNPLLGILFWRPIQTLPFFTANIALDKGNLTTSPNNVPSLWITIF